MSTEPSAAATTTGSNGSGPLLAVEDLRVGFATEDGRVQAVDRVSFDLEPGEVLAIVGESGSGKSVTAQTLIGLTRSPNSRIEGSVRLRGEELTSLSEKELQRIRGRRIAMIFQDPMTSLNPVLHASVSRSAEALWVHDSVAGQVARRAHATGAIELLDARRHSGRRTPSPASTRTSSPGACVNER